MLSNERLTPLLRRIICRELFAVIAFLCGAVLVWAFAGALPGVIQATLWAALLIGGIVSLHRVWHHLFGPVLYYDLVRTSRTGQPIAHRCAYAVALAIMLGLVYFNWFPRASWHELFRPEALSQQERARFANAFFTSFMTLQIVVVALITPLYTADAIVTEKERRTL